jgi:transcriptional regulator with XRE-family HTH domain
MQQIKQIMQQKGVTPYRLSKITGIAQSTLSRWLSGKQKPLKENYDKVVEALEGI